MSSERRRKAPEPDLLGQREAMPGRPRLHINTSGTCNNNCIFCVEDNRRRRLETMRNQSDDDVYRLLEENAALREVCFTSGEPTTNPSLPRYIEWARDLGYEMVSLITNGRRLMYLGYARELLEAGLNHLLVSIHGHTRQIHDGQTRTRGSFEQVVTGLRNLKVLKRRYRFTLHTATVVSRRNYQNFGEMIPFFRGFEVDQIVFNVIHVYGRALIHFDRLVPRYEDVVGAFADYLAQARPPDNVFLLDIPLCASERLPGRFRGYIEDYSHFDFEEKDLPPVEQRRSQFHSRMMLKREECSACRYNRLCDGVWGEYIARYGWREFVPVAPDGRDGDGEKQ